MKSKEKTKQPSIRQLEYFVNIAMSSNFRKAAEKLHISQPTLTSQISTLEESLGTQLFERSRAGTLLSPAGRELLPMARRVLEQYQELIDQAANSVRELNGTFKLGISSTIGPYLLPQVLPELHRRYPQLKLHVREAVPRDLELGLDKGLYDLIITMLPINSTENRVRPLFIEPVELVVAEDHPLGSLETITAKDLNNQQALTIDESHYLNKQIAEVCERFGARVQREFEGNSIDTLRQMAEMGMGFTFLPALYTRSKIKASDNLRVVRMEDVGLSRTHVASWRRNSPSRHLFQKISFDIKTIAIDAYSGLLEELSSEESV